MLLVGQGEVLWDVGDGERSVRKPSRKQAGTPGFHFADRAPLLREELTQEGRPRLRGA